MSGMSTRVDATSSPVRRGAVIAALLATVWLLAGCSSGASDSSFAGVEEAYEQAEEADGATGGAADSAEAADDRALIVTGAMYMTVEDPIAAADRAEDIVTSAGGRIDSRSETAPGAYDGGSARLTLRIPAAALDSAVDELRALGTVDEFTTDSADVTTEVRDLDAQISTLRASTARIESLLADAEDIKDIITLEDELDGRQARLESLEARQRGLDDQVSMSTIDLSLTTEPIVIVDDAPRSFWGGLESGWNGLVAFVSGALVITGVLLPWVIALALIGAVALAAVRTVRSRRARAASSEAEEAPAPAAPAGGSPSQDA